MRNQVEPKFGAETDILESPLQVAAEAFIWNASRGESVVQISPAPHEDTHVTPHHHGPIGPFYD